MDTLIFLLIFLALIAGFSRHRWLTLTLYFAALAATLLLFASHVTDPLNLSF